MWEVSKGKKPLSAKDGNTKQKLLGGENFKKSKNLSKWKQQKGEREFPEHRDIGGL